MRHYKARRRRDGRWDYTCGDRDGAVPAGYCTPKPDTSKPILPGMPWPEEEARIIEANADRYHEDGHATEEEAVECYRQYLLDRLLTSEIEPPTCIECGAPATVQMFPRAHLGALGPFCAAHATRDVAAKHLHVGESWES